jgi:putative endonuclease
MPPVRRPRWSIYVVRCRDGSLYTGIALDVAARLAQHAGSGGRGAKYLRGRGPLRLELFRAVGSRSLAQSIERRIKSLSREQKLALLGQRAVLDRMLASARAAPSGVRAAIARRTPD